MKLSRFFITVGVIYIKVWFVVYFFYPFFGLRLAGDHLEASVKVVEIA